MKAVDAARSVSDYVTKVRRTVHQNPELSFQEHETTGLIVDELQALGLEVTRWEDITGAMGLLRGVQSGPTVALRADIDALPIQERTGLPYASQNDGVMHACAHEPIRPLSWA